MSEISGNEISDNKSGVPIAPRLKGRRALVTGASRGIGRAVAVRFAAEGADVAINYAGGADAAQETARLAEAAGRAAGHDTRTLVIGADVSREDQVVAMVAAVVAAWGRLDILVNNAGIQTPSPSHQLPLADYERILGVNLTGAMLCAREAIAHFLSRPGGGAIVNDSSVHQLVPKPSYLAYSIAKGGLRNLTATLALEYAGRGIRVNAVAPGAILTDMNKAWAGDAAARADVESHIPMGRAGEPEEMAAVFAFLASPDASYITGQTIYACGGLTLYGDFRTDWASQA